MSTDELSNMSAGSFGRESTPLRRVIGLARANATLLMRNRLTASYAVVFPLLPLAFIPLGNADRATDNIVLVLLLIGLFPGYYNLLSATVTRRDELVLKRLRTGESTNREILISMALPGIVIGMLSAMIAIPIAIALGAQVPVNLPLFLICALMTLLLFAALAYWTAAWTKTAEAAQITSMPVMMVALLGNIGTVFPEPLSKIADATFGGAITNLVALSWGGEPVGGGAQLGFSQTWLDAAQPVTILICWTVLALALAKRSMRWEPRA